MIGSPDSPLYVNKHGRCFRVQRSDVLLLITGGCDLSDQMHSHLYLDGSACHMIGTPKTPVNARCEQGLRYIIRSTLILFSPKYELIYPFSIVVPFECFLLLYWFTLLLVASEVVIKPYMARATVEFL